MPIFAPGSTHVGHVTFTLPPSGMAGTVHLFLATADANHNPVTVKVDMTPVAFTTTGQSQEINIPGVVIPTSASGLSVTAFADVYLAGVLIYPLYAPEGVTIPGPSGGSITWD